MSRNTTSSAPQGSSCSRKFFSPLLLRASSNTLSFQLTLQAKADAATHPLPRPTIRSILVRPERVSPSPPPRDHSAGPAPASVKASGREERSAKTVHDPFPSHGWQEVCRKVFRKKSADQPRYHRRPVHERLQLPTGLGKRAGVAISCVFIKFQWLANPNVSFSIGTSVARIMRFGMPPRNQVIGDR
jgi:hypothetical protein